jgi:hypothetical protein
MIREITATASTFTPVKNELLNLDVRCSIAMNKPSRFLHATA